MKNESAGQDDETGEQKHQQKHRLHPQPSKETPSISRSDEPQI